MVKLGLITIEKNSEYNTYFFALSLKSLVGSHCRWGAVLVPDEKGFCFDFGRKAG